MLMILVLLLNYRSKKHLGAGASFVRGVVVKGFFFFFCVERASFLFCSRED